MCALGLPFEQSWKSLARVWLRFDLCMKVSEHLCSGWFTSGNFLNKVETCKACFLRIFKKRTPPWPCAHCLYMLQAFLSFLQAWRRFFLNFTTNRQQFVSPWFAFLTIYLRQTQNLCDSFFNSVDLGPFRDVSTSSCPACCPRRCLPRKEPLFKFAYLA